MDQYIRGHEEHMKRQRSRRQGSPKRSRHPVPAPVQTGPGADDASIDGSLPSTPPVGLGFAHERDSGQARADGATTSPTRSLRPPISPTHQRSTSSNLSSQISPASSATSVPTASSPPPTGSDSRPTTPVVSGSRQGSRPSTPSRSPLSLKRLSRNPSATSALASNPAAAEAGFRYEGAGADATIKAPMRTRSHSALPGEQGNDLMPVQAPSRSVSLKVERRSSGRMPPPPLPLPGQGRNRSETIYSQVSSGSSATPDTGATSRAESTLSSPARSRSGSAAPPPPPLLMHHSSSSMYQPSPPPSPNISATTISNLLKSTSLGKKSEKGRERKASFSAADAEARTRSGSNESQVSGGRVARVFGLGKR